MKRINYLLLIIALLISCSNNLVQKQLIGKYKLNTNNADLICTYKDNSYIHQFFTKEGLRYVCRGKWHYNGKEIDFDDFAFFNNSGFAGGKGTWISKVKSDAGEIRLIYSSENDIYYVKE